jgi:hypothetical protein
MKRWVIAAFALGFSLAFVLPVLALMFVPFELFGRALLPGLLLIPRRLLDAMAGWPGLLNLSIGGVANGLVYAAVAALVVLVRRRLRALRPAR